MKRFLFALIALFAASSAHAQVTCPAFSHGAVLTAAQWQACFDSKQNALGYTPLNVAGGTMLGRLVTATPGANTAGLNLTPGSAPASPADGDMWVTTAGLFVQANGTTVGPLSGEEASGFAGTSPITVSFPGGIVTYAFDLSVANSFLATQTFQAIKAGTTNTYDIGTNATTSAFRTLYAGTSVVGPVGTFTTSVAAGGCSIGGNTLCSAGTTLLSNSIVYGGVTVANSVTGTGSMVLGTSPSIANPTFTGSITAPGLVTNAALAFSSVTVNGSTCTLGSTCTTGFNVAQLSCGDYSSSTDNRAALQAAIDATPSGGTLFIPATQATNFTYCNIGKNPTNVAPTLLSSWYSLYITKPIHIICDRGVALRPDSTNTNSTVGGYPGQYGTIAGGSSYTNGTYTAVPLTGGGGSGAKATITVAGGAVTSVIITDGGAGGYSVSNVLSASAANIGGTGSGFTYTLTTLVSGTDIVYIKGTLDGLNIPTIVEGCFIGDPTVATRYGRHAIVLDTLTDSTYFRAPIIRNVFTQAGASGNGYGVVAVNDTLQPNQFNGGIYGGIFGDGSMFYGGLWFTGTGDSNVIRNAIVPQCIGCGTSDNNGILLSPINTAGSTTLQEVNFSQSKGVKVTSGINFAIMGGEYELQATLTGTALIDLNGADGTLYNAKIIGAQLQANAGLGTPLLINATSNVANFVLMSNFIATPTSYTGVANASTSFICGPNYWSTGSPHYSGTAPSSSFGGTC